MRDGERPDGDHPVAPGTPASAVATSAAEATPPKAATKPGAGVLSAEATPPKAATKPGVAVLETLPADATPPKAATKPGVALLETLPADAKLPKAATKPGVALLETLPADATPPKTATKPGVALLETLPADAKLPKAATKPGVALLETLPAASVPASTRTKAQTGDTRPGPGFGQAAAAPHGAAGAAHDAGKPAAVMAGDGETLAGPASPQPMQPVIRPPQAHQRASDETLDAPPAGGTLQGPYTVADLPSLPRVDDATYALGSEIARGGMGKILAARDRRLRREVVIKVMRREYGRIDPRFEREALITARLQHPSIVRVYDAGVLGDGRAFYAMERVRGRSLEVVLAEATTLRERLALLPHAIAVCEALAYAHNEGVVHRDLKPSNVLLGPFGETVVIDWGLAKDLRAGEGTEPSPLAGAGAGIAGGATDRDASLRRGDDGGRGDDDDDSEGGAEPRHVASGSGVRAGAEGTSVDGSNLATETNEPRSGGSAQALTQIGAVMGTPAFMAPEQARGELADERTDVYALGALLYTMLTGVPPVTGPSSDAVIEAVATGKRKKIDEAEPALPRELVTIVEHAMGHTRADRYQSAKQLADDLRSFAAGKLVPSHEYSTWELVKRWVAKHRVSVGITLAGLLILTVTIVVAFRKLAEERDAANTQRELAVLKEFEAWNKRDNLIFGQALEIRATDPSYAAAWLKLLSDRALGWDKTAQLADELGAAGLAQVFVGHRQDVELVAASPDGTYVATGSDDSTVRLWDLTSGGSVELAGHTGPIETMTMSGDGKLLATAGTDHKVILWTLANGARRDLAGHTNTVRGVAFSPDHTKLASAGEDGSLYLWDIETAKGNKVLQYTHSLRPLAWIGNTTLLAGSFDGRVAHVDIKSKKISWYREQRTELRSIAVTPDGTTWITADEDGQVVVWDGIKRTKIRSLATHQQVAREAIITPDQKHVVTAGGNDAVHVHSLPDGAFVALKGNESAIKDIDVSSDGLVASAGIDGTVRVWKLDGTPLHTWRGHGAAVKGCTFVGRHVVSGSEDHKVRLWNLDAPPPPPRGAALRAWLDQRTNLTGPATATGSARTGE